MTNNRRLALHSNGKFQQTCGTGGFPSPHVANQVIATGEQQRTEKKKYFLAKALRKCAIEVG